MFAVLLLARLGLAVASAVPGADPTTMQGHSDQELFNALHQSISKPVEASGGAPKTWKAKIKEVCMYDTDGSMPLPTDHDTFFLECIQPANFLPEWKAANLGIYTLKRCKSGMTFFTPERKCKTRRWVRRQAASCLSGLGGGNCGAYQPMPVQSSCGNCATPGQCQGGCAGQQTYQPVYPAPAPQPVYPAPQPAYPQPSSGCGCPMQAGQCPPACQPAPAPVSACPCPQPTGACPSPCPAPVAPAPNPCQASCGQSQTCCQQVINTPGPCRGSPVPAAQARNGAQCSFQLEPLAVDPSNARGYLQCKPQGPAGPLENCGIWCPRPCAPGTRFDVRVQVCVFEVLPQVPSAACGCPPAAQPLGSCNMQPGAQMCPGTSTCQQTQIVAALQPASSCSQCCLGGGGYGK